jgi:hypothetical protein
VYKSGSSSRNFVLCIRVVTIVIGDHNMAATLRTHFLFSSIMVIMIVTRHKEFCNFRYHRKFIKLFDLKIKNISAAS